MINLIIMMLASWYLLPPNYKKLVAKNNTSARDRTFFATNSLQYLKRKKWQILVSVIIKLIIILVSRCYYSCSTYNCVSKPKIYLVHSLKSMYNHTRNISTKIELWPDNACLELVVFSHVGLYSLIIIIQIIVSNILFTVTLNLFNFSINT